MIKNKTLTKKWMNQGLAVILSSAILLGACADTDSTATQPTDTIETTQSEKTETVDTTEATESTSSETAPPGQGGPPGGGMEVQSDPKDSIIDIVEKVAEMSTTVDTDVTENAEAFLATLTSEQLEAVTYEFTEENAEHWTNLPANSENRNGIALGDLSEESVEAALILAKSALSEQGFSTLLDIIRSDEFLTTDTGRTEWGSGLYYIALLGTPSESDTWMLQISGHHLAENLVFNGEQVSATPQFTGTEPQTFELDGVTYSPIETRRDGLYSIIDSLDESQLDSAEIAASFQDVVVGADHDGEFPEESEGILYSELDENQQELVKTAIRTWVEDSDAETAEALLEAYLDEEALAETYIGWSGSTDANDVGSYVRIDGPRLWLELASQQGVGYSSDETTEAHFHTVWRDKLADYGGEFTE